MRNWIQVVLFLLGTMVMSAPDAARWQVPAKKPADTLSGQLRITGSDTMLPLVTAIAKRFQTLHPAVAIDILSGGSSRGIADVAQDKADIGMASRALKDSERGLTGLPIARDGIAVVIHKDNPLRALTDQQITSIYTGKFSNWKQLGGRDVPILVVMSAVGGGSYELFTSYFGLRTGDIKSQRVLGDNTARLSLMAENPNAILYMSVSEATRSALAGAAIKLLPIADTPATSKNINNGNYPLSRPLTLVTKSLPRGLTKIFIEYSLSSEVTDLVIAHDFVPYMD